MDLEATGLKIERAVYRHGELAVYALRHVKSPYRLPTYLVAVDAETGPVPLGTIDASRADPTALREFLARWLKHRRRPPLRDRTDARTVEAVKAALNALPAMPEHERLTGDLPVAVRLVTAGSQPTLAVDMAADRILSHLGIARSEGGGEVAVASFGDAVPAFNKGYYTLYPSTSGSPRLYVQFGTHASHYSGQGLLTLLFRPSRSTELGSVIIPADSPLGVEVANILELQDAFLKRTASRLTSLDENMQKWLLAQLKSGVPDQPIQQWQLVEQAVDQAMEHWGSAVQWRDWIETISPSRAFGGDYDALFLRGWEDEAKAVAAANVLAVNRHIDAMSRLDVGEVMRFQAARSKLARDFRERSVVAHCSRTLLRAMITHEPEYRFGARRTVDIAVAGSRGANGPIALIACRTRLRTAADYVPRRRGVKGRYVLAVDVRFTADQSDRMKDTGIRIVSPLGSRRVGSLTYESSDEPSLLSVGRMVDELRDLIRIT